MLTCSHPIFPSPSLPLHLLRTTSQRPQGWHLREPHLTAWWRSGGFSSNLTAKLPGWNRMKQDETKKNYIADIAKVLWEVEQKLSLQLSSTQLTQFNLQKEVVELCQALPGHVCWLWRPRKWANSWADSWRTLGWMMRNILKHDWCRTLC